MKSDRLPQCLLLTGPAGIGKQRVALWLAQLLLCERRGDADEPCGECRSCHLVQGLTHSDVHWIVPIPRPKAADTDKQVEEAAELIGEVVAERRKDPLYGPTDGMAGHGMATVRLIQRRSALTAVEGGPRLFIIGDADRLVTQEASQEAANALLKLLEEPPSRCYFVLTTSDARRLLPTIQSRSVPLRLAPLPDAEVRDFLAAHLKPVLASRELDERVEGAEGSIGAAVSAGGEGAVARGAAEALLEAVKGSGSARFERALKQNPWSARGDFSAMLDALAELLADAAREAVGERSRRPVPSTLRGVDAGAALAAIERVAAAKEAAGGNVNPQLLIAVLSEELAETL